MLTFNTSNLDLMGPKLAVRDATSALLAADVFSQSNELNVPFSNVPSWPAFQNGVDTVVHGFGTSGHPLAAAMGVSWGIAKIGVAGLQFLAEGFSSAAKTKPTGWLRTAASGVKSIAFGVATYEAPDTAVLFNGVAAAYHAVFSGAYHLVEPLTRPQNQAEAEYLVKKLRNAFDENNLIEKKSLRALLATTPAVHLSKVINESLAADHETEWNQELCHVIYQSVRGNLGNAKEFADLSDKIFKNVLTGFFEDTVPSYAYLALTKMAEYDRRYLLQKIRDGHMVEKYFAVDMLIKSAGNDTENIADTEQEIREVLNKLGDDSINELTFKEYALNIFSWTKRSNRPGEIFFNEDVRNHLGRLWVDKLRQDSSRSYNT